MKDRNQAAQAQQGVPRRSESKMNGSIGKSFDRVDGRLKVTGTAKYAAEFSVPNVAHGVMVMSTIASGRIKSIDTRVAEGALGVLAVITHTSAPKLPYHDPKEKPDVDPKVGQQLRPLRDDIIYFNGQPVAVVVAETLEQAEYAATLVRVTYSEEKAATRVEDEMARAFPPKEGSKDYNTASEPQRPADVSRGNPNALAAASVRVDNSYTIPIEHHNPIELHATIAVWDRQGGQETLTLYDKTQWVRNTRTHVALSFGMPEEQVRVISQFVGGGFGSALRPWVHPVLTAIAARVVQRPVKLVLSREQMFTSTGYRPYTIQRVALGANRDGRLTAIVHEATAQTSPYEEFTESTLKATRMLYACPNLVTKYRLVRTNTNTPTYMRGPGEASGVYALEVAMDELAYTLKIDPVELRVRNHADVNPQDGLPWSSKSLKECYRLAAERFGWSRRNPEPRSMRDGRYLTGMGMATATYPMNYAPSSARTRFLLDGDTVSALVQTAASDMGPGTYTTQTIIAADTLGLPVERIRFQLGDSNMPNAPVHGGSLTTASVGSAVQGACQAALDKLLAIARADSRSPLRGVRNEDVVAEQGRIYLKSNPSQGETYADILRRHNQQTIEASFDNKPGDALKRFSMYAFGAHFVEVTVEPDFGEVRVRRVVGAYGCGRVINPKTARSQAIGGTVGGIGMALQEETHMDRRYGRYVNPNLGEYHVPVNADIPVLEAYFVEEHDPYVNPIGAKGLGEIAIVGVAAAVANAVFHATGKRIRDLPITPDKLL